MKNVKNMLQQYKNTGWVQDDIQLKSVVSLIDVIDGKIICEDRLLEAWCRGVVNGNFDFSGNGMHNNISYAWNKISVVRGCWFYYFNNVFEDCKINIGNIFKKNSLDGTESFSLKFASTQGYRPYKLNKTIFNNFSEIYDAGNRNGYELCSVSYYDLDRKQEIAEPNLCVLLKHDDGNWYRHGQEHVDQVDKKYVINKAAMSGHGFTYSKK